MVHGRARAAPRQTWRVALNEGSEEVNLRWEAASVLFSTKRHFLRGT